jgi:hypothetical protein
MLQGCTVFQLKNASSRYCVGKPDIELSGDEIGHDDEVFGATVNPLLSIMTYPQQLYQVLS